MANTPVTCKFCHQEIPRWWAESCIVCRQWACTVCIYEQFKHRRVYTRCDLCKQLVCCSCICDCTDYMSHLCKKCDEEHSKRQVQYEDENERVKWLLKDNPITITSAFTSTTIHSGVINFF